MEERENPDGGHSPIVDGDQSKWPLQPGVLIHINKLNNISISRLTPRVNPYKTTSVTTLKKFTRYSKYGRNRSKFCARLERLGDFLHGHKRGRERIPSGIKRGPAGVVTFRKVPPPPPDPSATRVRSRKRKKPGTAPHVSALDDKPRLDHHQHLPATNNPDDPDNKGFYENLPFHGMQNPSGKNAFYTLSTPNFKQLTTSNATTCNRFQYSATIPHQKHHHQQQQQQQQQLQGKLLPKSLFQEHIQKSKSFSSASKSKQQKKHHFQIPLQKCNSFTYQTAESYFQPIKNIHEENLIRNGYVDAGGKKQQQHQQHRNRHHQKKRDKSKGSRRLGDSQFREGLEDSVELQYPQPLIAGGRFADNNGVAVGGVVYADLDMAMEEEEADGRKCSNKEMGKQKTEYATLKFNDIGQEIDV